MKPTTKSANGTSFHDKTFNASVQELRKILGEPTYEQNDGEDKVNFDWTMETENGEIFTVYDWKEYRPLKEDEVIGWHIGSHTTRTSVDALKEINSTLDNLQNSDT